MLASTAKTRTARLSWQVGKSLVMPGKALLLSQSLPCPFPAAQASLALPPRERITVGALALAYANLRLPYKNSMLARAVKNKNKGQRERGKKSQQRVRGKMRG